ncbi:MAG: patatin-like phospholipase family protein [Flavobacteriales bacterium]|nr:patatin-like phospholipase family protein [Flavobacteriales bacterium]
MDRTELSRRARRILYFFPLQLLVLHVKKNHMLLLLWLLLFGYITQQVGAKYGVPYLFLYPEYFGRVSFWSYAILGFGLGGFITAYNLYSYTLHAYRFPFIATLSRPFLKFNFNNAVIPVLFVITYLVCSARLQVEKELLSGWEIVLNLVGFLTGIIAFLLIALAYFTRTNTDIHKMLGKDAEEHRAPEPMADLIAPPIPIPTTRQQKRKATRWFRREQRTRKWRVETYLAHPFKVALARTSSHYDKELLRSVIWQNHINGSVFEVVMVLSFVALGAFSNSKLFEIPAGASAFLLFTMLLMLFSAFNSWFKGWTTTVIIVLVLGLNHLSSYTEGFLYDNAATGLDYAAPPAPYDRNTIGAFANDTSSAQRDARAMAGILDRWRDHNRALPHAQDRPKLIIVNTSGGGLRAMLWTFRCLQHADSLLGGTLMQRTALLTGSSGGAIGATYYRQLSEAALNDPTVELQASSHLERMSSDMLNPVAFSFVTNDLFIRYRRVRDEKHAYTLDRGHVFERRLNELTDSLLTTRLDDLAENERAGRLPVLVLSPTVLNDGRRLVIGAQPMAFLTAIAPEAPVHGEAEAEAIEFRRMFRDQEAGRLTLASALRMGASFPYITPVVSLPSEPRMRVMDAGARDNYGYRNTFAYLHALRDWIAANTSGVVIIQVRDKQKDLDVRPAAGRFVSRLLDPVGSVYDNFVRIQDQDYDLMLKQADAWAGFPIERIDLQLRHDEADEISLSWHLTAVEKTQVLATVHSPENRAAFERLRELVVGAGPLLTQTGHRGSAPGLPAAPPSLR